MGISTSIFLLAAGAILRYAVTVEADGVNLHTVGVILMVVGAIGLLMSLIFWSSWGGFHRRDAVVHDDGGRRTVIER
jgi:hypothetical protein